MPCSIKESIGFEGMPNTAGVVARKGTLATRSAPTTQRLLDLGAIPLGVTNTSELTMWIESENRVYGRTNNAYDPSRTAGGSSGGEGALVGSGGAPIGLGSDIGGSIRLPAFFNGVFGHKCTAHLVPNSGQWPEAVGEPTRMLAVGPIVRRAEDLMPVLGAIAGPDGVDPDTREVTLGDPADVELSGLPVIVGQDITPPQDLARAAGRARARGRGPGGRRREVRNESLRTIRRAMEYYLATLAAGEVEEVWVQVGGEPGTRAPIRQDPAATPFRGRGDHTIALAILLAVERLADRVPDARNHKAVEAGRALAREVEGVIGDGVLLHPPFGRVAPRHGRTVGRPWVILPAAIFNLMGLPATEIPMGLNHEGLPLGVQAVAGRDRDHVSIAVALELERVFGGWVPPQ